MSRDTYAKLEAGGDTRTTKLRALATAFGVPLEVVLILQLTARVEGLSPPRTLGETTEDVAALKAAVNALQREVALLRGEESAQAIDTSVVSDAYKALEEVRDRHERRQEVKMAAEKGRAGRLSKKKRAK